MRVSDLLRMSTGHQTEPPLGRYANSADASKTWAARFLAHPVPFKPGTHFLYNTAATYMLSAIVQKATGENTVDYLRPRLFDPLGIKDPFWFTSPEGISLGGYGLQVRTEDIARFGQLYLNKGCLERQPDSSPPPGSIAPPPSKPQTAPPPQATGTRATATSSGAAGTTPTGATAPSASTASSCPSKTPSSPSPPASATCRPSSTSSGTTFCPPSSRKASRTTPPPPISSSPA